MKLRKTTRLFQYTDKSMLFRYCRNHMNFVNKVISQEYLNEGSIIYQLGIPSYMFIPFSNIDSSTNDIFSISLNSESAEVVTNVE